MVTFLDPRGRPGTAAMPYELRAPLDGAATIGLMANGFPDSDTFLDHIADAISTRLPDVQFQRFNKGNASSLADDAMLSEAAESCDAIIAAYGH
jgi:hypothetical protein